MINTLDFLYIVLAIGLIPTFTLLCMVLWRVYHMMDRVEAIIGFTEKTAKFVSNIDKVPAMLFDSIVSKFGR